jgi:hypothetical protein
MAPGWPEVRLEAGVAPVGGASLSIRLFPSFCNSAGCSAMGAAIYEVPPAAIKASSSAR